MQSTSACETSQQLTDCTLVILMEYTRRVQTSTELLTQFLKTMERAQIIKANYQLEVVQYYLLIPTLQSSRRYFITIHQSMELEFMFHVK